LQTRQDRRRVKELKRELRCKEIAQAEATALLVLSQALSEGKERRRIIGQEDHQMTDLYIESKRRPEAVWQIA
jgi:hypothetical protein